MMAAARQAAVATATAASPRVSAALAARRQRHFSKEAIVLGSSGMVGGLVVQRLLASPHWDAVHLVVRKPVSDELRAHSKVHEVLVPDLAHMAADPGMQALARAKRGAIDAAFTAVGVNEPWGWTVQRLVETELGLVSAFTDFCHGQLGVQCAEVLSMAGAARDNPLTAAELGKKVNYWNFFGLAPRVKGAIENAVLAAGIPHTSFFRPAQFETDEYRFGAADWVAQNASKVANLFLPWEWHSIHVNDIAGAMFADAERATDELAAAATATTDGVAAVGSQQSTPAVESVAQQHDCVHTYKAMMALSAGGGGGRGAAAR